mmetsp:Transcript_33697/g.41549  ORF Transcript_33697/g.41549 Transcript_33697/m.41549 type:complete len:122 (+) Transcript_33697:65-430(+)
MELLAFKVMDLVKTIEPAAATVAAASAVNFTEENARRLTTWTFKFFEKLRKLNTQEKSRYAEPKFMAGLKPLAKYLHSRHSGKPSGGGDVRSNETTTSPAGSKAGTLSFLDNKSQNSQTRR